MKRHLCIGFVFGLAMMVACNNPGDGSVAMRHGTSLPHASSPELAAIDSLMWRQPDSALAVLQQFAASPKADSLDELNGHYCQLLISELLYKNHYGQSNRPALQQAVRYFDSLSLCIALKHLKQNAKTQPLGANALGVSSPFLRCKDSNSPQRW